MIKQTISWCLCFILAFPHSAYATSADMQSKNISEQAIYKNYPDAKVIHIETEDYPQLASQLRAQGYLQKSQSLAMNYASNNNSEATTDSRKSGNCDNNSNAPSNAEESVDIMLDISSDILNNTSSNNDNAPVLFVIVGTIVVVVWVLYIFKYLYDVAAGFEPCGYWNQISFSNSRITSSSQDYARFRGIKYMTGFRDGVTEAGISVELGQTEINLPMLLNQKLEGTYWLIGPVLRWRFFSQSNPHYFNMSFVAGSTEHTEMGTIAKASLGLQFALGNAAHIGLNWGAMNIDVNGDQGIVQNRDEYFYLYGINFGFNF